MNMTLLKKRLFFYSCIFLLLLLNTFFGKYISAEFQSAMYIVLILIVSFSIVYLIVKELKSSGRKKLDTEKKKIVEAIAKKILEKKNAS